MRILTLFLRHGIDKYSDAHATAEEIARRTLPDVDRRTIIIDNALPPDTTKIIDERTTLTGGDNIDWEFSGWDSGVRFVGSEIWSYDYVHLVTSAFGELHTGYPDRFDSRMLRACSDRPIALGHIDCFNHPARLRGYITQHWIRSSYFFVRPAEIMALGSLVSLRNTEWLFTDDPKEPFRADAPVDSGWRRNIISWLTGDGTGQGVVWHSRFDLTAETLPYFKKKTRAILNEHLLSVRLRALGCRLADVTWLAGAIARMPGDIQIPAWREQLANREQDKVILPESE